MEPMNIAIEGLTLDTVLFADYDGGAVTLRQLIIDAAVDRLMKDKEFKNVTYELAKRVSLIRDEEIRAQVAPIITEALNGEIRKTNQWGEQLYGDPITLKQLIVERANEFFTKDISDRYSRGKGTQAQQLVDEAVKRELTGELSDAIKVEKEKVVAQVRAAAADLIAQAVTKGIGRG